jgi:hypothetical protein
MGHTRKSGLLDPEAVTTVEPQQQLQFLSNIQRLLSEGQFTATYKYALLLALRTSALRTERTTARRL